MAERPSDRRIVERYLVDGRLVTIPTRGAKRDAVLRYLRDVVFDEDREYPEREVNERLRRFHEDVAALRRYLVDGGYATRARGLYRRR